jgi:hypothetical protein
MRYLRYLMLVFLVGVGLLDLIYVVFRRGYNHYNKFEQTRLKHIFNDTTYHDALFIGSSRTYYHINPKIIDTVMKLNSFNAGIDGANLLETNLILNCYLASHPAPKYVIADLSTPAFDIQPSSVFNPNIYYPFLSNKIVFNTLKPYKRVNLLRYFPFLQITECDDFLRQGAVAGLMGEIKPLAPQYKGYLESGRDTIPLPFRITYLTTDYPVNKKGTDLLLNMINTCRAHNIKLIVTYSPVYNNHDEKMNPEFFPTLTKICDTTGTTFLNYREITLSQNHRFFRDELHLNRFGADIFSRMLARDLNRMIFRADNRPGISVTSQVHKKKSRLAVQNS